MRTRFEVVVRLKDGLLDPQGKTIEEALPTMGWGTVSGVRVGKHVELTVEAANESEARSAAEEIAGRLLANPVIEEFRIVSSVALPEEGFGGGDRGGRAPRGTA